MAAVETRLQRLKRIAIFSSRLLAAPSASDNQTSATLGTMWTKADGRRSARLTSTTETGDDDGAAPGGAVADATDRLTDSMATGGGETGIPGRPMMCIDHARCGLASWTQKNNPAYCCDACAITAGFEHTENCGYRTALEVESHVPGSIEMELILNDATPEEMYFLMPARTRSTWSEHKSGPWHPAAHELAGLVVVELVYCRQQFFIRARPTSLSQNIYHDWTVAMAWGGTESLKGWYVDDDDKVARGINKRAQAFVRRGQRFARSYGFGR